MARLRVHSIAHVRPGICSLADAPAVVVIRPRSELPVTFAQAIIAGERESNISAMRRCGINPDTTNIVISMNVQEEHARD